MNLLELRTTSMFQFSNKLESIHHQAIKLFFESWEVDIITEGGEAREDNITSRGFIYCLLEIERRTIFYLFIFLYEFVGT